jgi:hypothetical protein
MRSVHEVRACPLAVASAADRQFGGLRSRQGLQCDRFAVAARHRRNQRRSRGNIDVAELEPTFVVGGHRAADRLRVGTEPWPCQLDLQACGDQTVVEPDLTSVAGRVVAAAVESRRQGWWFVIERAAAREQVVEERGGVLVDDVVIRTPMLAVEQRDGLASRLAVRGLFPLLGDPQSQDGIKRWFDAQQVRVDQPEQPVLDVADLLGSARCVGRDDSSHDIHLASTRTVCGVGPA